MPKIIITKDADDEILGMVISAVKKLSSAPNPKNTSGTGMFLDRPRGRSNEFQLSNFVGIVPFQTDFRIVQR